MGVDRRKFLKMAVAGVIAGTLAGAGSSTVKAQQDGNETGGDQDGDGGGGEPTTHEVSMVTDGQEYYFDPIGLHVQPGDTVRWVIESGSHSSTAYGDRIPDGAEAWDSGILQEQGATFEYTFEQEGTYDYFCTPHEQLGMVARIVCGQPGGPAEQGEIPNKGQVATGTVPDSQTIVDQGSLSYPYQPGGNGGGDGGEEGAETLEEMGVPYQAHFVGLAALFGVFVSLIYSFYFLKYAESPQHKDQRDR